MAKTAVNPRRNVFVELFLKLRHSEKARNFETNLPLVLTLLSKCQSKWETFSIFVAFLENFNFTLCYYLSMTFLIKRCVVIV